MTEAYVYEAVSAGLQEALARVAALAVVLDHEPTAVHETPLLYSLLEGTSRARDGGTGVERRYTTLHRLCLSWQDSATTEALLRQLVDEIPDAIEADPRLGGRVRPGVALVTRGEAGWVTIGNTWYRSVDFFSEVLVMTRYLGLRR